MRVAPFFPEPFPEHRKPQQVNRRNLSGDDQKTLEAALLKRSVEIPPGLEKNTRLTRVKSPSSCALFFDCHHRRRTLQFSHLQ